MDNRTNGTLDFEQINDVESSDEVWDCNILSVMSEKISIYNSWTAAPISKYYKQPQCKPTQLNSLLQEDLEYYSSYIPEISSILNCIELIQYDSQIPGASVLISSSDTHSATIGVSKNFIKFVHVYMSKFYTLIQKERKSNIHEIFEDEALSDKWRDDNLYISVLDDSRNYHSIDYEKAIKEYHYLYEPYEYCDTVIAIRQFALLHEVAHFYIRLNREKFNPINPDHEEFIADRLAYDWLLTPYLSKESLCDTDRYELSMHIKAPMYFFVSQFLPFSIHYWEKDKKEVLIQNKRRRYIIHPLRREMNLVANLINSDVFKKMPEALDYMMGYFQCDKLGYEYHVFLRSTFGSFYELKLIEEDPQLSKQLRLLRQSVSDAYYTYNDLDQAITFDHEDGLRWIISNWARRVCEDTNDRNVIMDLDNCCDQVYQRRIGVGRDMYMNEQFLALHNRNFGFRAERGADIIRNREDYYLG